MTLSDTGGLLISYLGTDQMTQADLGKLHQSEAEVDYLALDQKHQMLMEKIK